MATLRLSRVGRMEASSLLVSLLCSILMRSGFIAYICLFYLLIISFSIR